MVAAGGRRSSAETPAETPGGGSRPAEPCPASWTARSAPVATTAAATPNRVRRLAIARRAVAHVDGVVVPVVRLAGRDAVGDVPLVGDQTVVRPAPVVA